MFGLESIIAVFISARELLKDKYNKSHSLSSKHWNNQERLNKDLLDNNVSHKQIIKNAEKGKYYSEDLIMGNDYTQIVDTERYEKDLELYGYELTEKLRKNGNYNYKNNV